MQARLEHFPDLEQAELKGVEPETRYNACLFSEEAIANALFAYANHNKLGDRLITIQLTDETQISVEYERDLWNKIRELLP